MENKYNSQILYRSALDLAGPKLSKEMVKEAMKGARHDGGSHLEGEDYSHFFN